MSPLNPIIIVLVFCVILFFYLHIQYQFKCNSDLELFEIYETTKDNMEEICNMRQPTVFTQVDEHLMNTLVGQINKEWLETKYAKYSVQVREMNSNEYASLPLNASLRLMNKGDVTQHYFYSENNQEFLSEIGFAKKISDRVLRPYLCGRSTHDIMFGSQGSSTPLRYSIYFRNYYVCTKGIVYVKLIPPKYAKKLDTIYDYDLFEFRSPHHMWNDKFGTATHHSIPDVKSLEIALSPGKLLYIPAYWWYSFQYGEDATLVNFSYQTYMNRIAQSHHSFMYFLQQNNIRKKFTKPNLETKKLQGKMVGSDVKSKENEDIDELTFRKKSQENEPALASIDNNNNNNNVVMLPDPSSSQITETNVPLTNIDDKSLPSATVPNILQTIEEIDEEKEEKEETIVSPESEPNNIQPILEPQEQKQEQEQEQMKKEDTKEEPINKNNQ